MKIDKAMIILSLLMEVKARRGEIDQHDAIKLGIEAMKRIESLRGYLFSARHPLLPREN